MTTNANPFPMIRIYSERDSQSGSRNGAYQWLQRFHRQRPFCACILGFTETALIPGISAAGATPRDRQTTAIADAEFLYNGPTPQPTWPLPPLTVGVSPAFISRAVLQTQQIPLQVFNAGLLQSPPIPHIDLGGQWAQCVRSGHALSQETVQHLFQTGWEWGQRLSQSLTDSYLIIGECVVAGTTTALAVLTGLGRNAAGKVNSSHPTCNHQQKWEIVKAGLAKSGLQHCPHIGSDSLQVQTWRRSNRGLTDTLHPLDVLAAVGDPMQPVAAGMAIAASQTSGVLLAGGTQMLAIYAVIQAWATHEQLDWQPKNVLIGTTRWVAEDPTGDTIGLAKALNAPLIATQLHFRGARYPQLQIYEQGFVKEGVAAGGCAIAATLYQDWGQGQILEAVETLMDDYQLIVNR